MSAGRPPEFIGTPLAEGSPRPCGLCGETRRLTRTHVPPRTAGNTSRVERAPDLLTAAGVRRPGRWNRGGLWVRGLCEDCNQLAGRRYDEAYGDFSRALEAVARARNAGSLLPPSDAPHVLLAPGLVSRCILIGMFAIHPRLRQIFPILAENLRNEEPTLRWPESVQLRVGQHQGSRALLASGIFMARVLGHRTQHFTFSDVVFAPLVWSLVPESRKHSPSTSSPMPATGRTTAPSEPASTSGISCVASRPSCTLPSRVHGTSGSNSWERPAPTPRP